MLNRRILRIKAMQSIYAFNKAQESNFHIALDLIADKFIDALLIHGKEHKEQMDEAQAKAVELFKKHYAKGVEKDIKEESPSELIEKITTEAMYFYQRQEHDELSNIKRRMVAETEHLFNKYLRLIRLAGDLADYIQDVQRKKEKKTGMPAREDFAKFFENPLLARLREHPDVKKEQYKWELEQIVDWSKMLRAHEGFLPALNDASEGLEGEKEILAFVFREFMFKTDAILSHLEESDLNWAENKSVVRNMLLKTLKGVDDTQGEIELFTLSRNWDDDKQFFETLFKKTVEHDQAWEAKIAQKTKKWASDRIATIDKILMKMSLTEMVSFPSIPVKVSINEYLEISKNYSTPKSWQFMNGVLDAVSAEMKEAGEIRKSGRGLLDNK